MDELTYRRIEAHMLRWMQDSAHDRLHVYRVLRQARQIALSHPEADSDILTASCLLHDIGRQAQFENPDLCHAEEGGKMAYAFLRTLLWPEDRCQHVAQCIATHRYRTDNPPQSIEAKILFDADKLDVTGAIGVARSLIYGGQVGEPLYCLDSAGHVMDGSGADDPDSFLHEYHFKLSRLYDRFYTPEARQMAHKRRAILDQFYFALLDEIGVTQE